MNQRFRNPDLLLMPVVVIGLGVIGWALDVPKAVREAMSPLTARGLGVAAGGEQGVGGPPARDGAGPTGSEPPPSPGAARESKDDAAQVPEPRTDAAAQDDGRSPSGTAQAEADAKLDAERQRVVALTEKLAEAERASTAADDGFRQQLNGERARSASLDGDLAAARDRLAQVERDKAVADAERRTVKAAAATDALKLQDAEGRAAALSDLLAAAERDGAAGHDGGAARSAHLEHDLAAARDRLAQAERDKAAADAGRGTAEAAAAGATAKLHEAERRAAALGDRLAAAERDAAAQHDDGAARSADLERDLAAARDRLAQAERDKAAADAGRGTAEADAAGATAKLREAEQRAATLGDRLAAAERDADARVAASQKQADGEHDRSATLDRDLAETRDRLVQADRDRAASEDGHRSVDVAAAATAGKLRDAQQRATALGAGLAAAERDAGARVDGLQKQLDGERARSAALDRDLAGLRDRWAQAGRASSVSDDERRTAEAAAAASAQRLQDAQQRAAALTHRLAEAERAASDRVDELQSRLDGENAKSTALDRDLADLRERLAQAGRATAAADGERRAAEAAAAANAGYLRDQERRVVDLADRLAGAERDAAARVDDVRHQLDAERSRSAGLARGLTAARARSEKAERDGTVREAARWSYGFTAMAEAARSRGRSDVDPAIVLPRAEDLRRLAPPSSPPAVPAGRRSPPEAAAAPATADQEVGPGSAAQRPDADAAPSAAPSGPVAGAVASPSRGGLPEDAPARVILRYARGSETARARAMALKLTLAAAGVDVSDPVVAPTGIGSSGVTYFYNEDRGSADRIAGVLGSSGPVKSRLRSTDPHSRPGTIEVAIAG